MSQARITIGAEDRFSGVFGKLRGELRSAGQQAGLLSGAFSAINPALAGALSAGALVALARATVNGVDALNDLKDATGASIENLSGLEDVAARTGTSMETVGSAVVKLNKTLADAKPGSDAAKALDALGLSAKELKAQDPAEALRLVAVALAGFADDGNKARLTQELFGKSLREVAPLLKDLSEAGELSAKVTTEQAQAAEDFNKQLFALEKNSLDVARAISGPLVLAINGLFSASKKEGGIGRLLGLDNVAERVDAVVGAYRLLAIARERITPVSILQKDPNNEVALAELARLDKKARDIAASATAAKQALLGIGTSTAGAGRGNVIPDIVRPSLSDISAGAGKAGKAAREPFVFQGPLLDQAGQDAIKALEQTDIAKLAALREQLAALISVRAAGGDSGRVDEALAATVEQITRLDPAAQRAADSAKRLQIILAQTPSAQFDAVLSNIELLNQAFADGSLTAEKWAEAIQVATARLPAATEEPIKAISTFAEQAGRNIQDALGTTLEDVLSGNFKSIGKLWSDLVTRMAAQAAAAELNKYLFGDTFGGKGGSSGALSSLFAGFGGFFASGGTLGAGKWGIAGEAGAEIVRGPASITPMGAMGGTTVVQHYHINGDVSPQTVALIRAEGSRTKADILRSMRTGGAYAGAY